MTLVLHRVLHGGDHGGDVRGAQRALRVGLVAAGRRPVNLTTGFYGHGSIIDTEAFQHAHKLHVDGKVGPFTFAALRPFVDRYGAWLINRYTPPKKPEANDVVRRMTHAELWGVAHHASIHYRQLRPIDGHHHPYKLPLYTDCSGFDTDCAEWSGLEPQFDPNGLSFNGEGYTGTSFSHGVRVSVDAVGRHGPDWFYHIFYSWNHAIGAPEHEVYAFRQGGPSGPVVVVSHGHEGDPSLQSPYWWNAITGVRAYRAR